MIGRVRLRVADADRVRTFYERAIGVRGSSLVELIGDPDAPPAPAGSTGLFHLAILVPDRPSLAQAVQRVLDSGWRFTGASDHFVSEAFYLRDPEGNGIEIYRDRPRSEWTYGHDGELEMGTVALDVQGVMAELPSGSRTRPATACGSRRPELQLRHQGERDRRAHGSSAHLSGLRPTNRALGRSRGRSPSFPSQPQ
jgi:catechol-2,3-dioxygenase